MKTIFLAAAVVAVTSIFSGTHADAADLSIVKTGPASITAGATVTFTLNAATVGTLPLPAGIVTTVTDTVPSLFTQVTVTSAPSWGCTVSGQLVSCTRSLAIAANTPFPVITVTAKANTAGNYLNCANVSFVPNPTTQPDQVPGNNNSCVNGVITGGGKTQDVGIKKGGGGTVNAGATVTFTLNPFNVGPGSVGVGGVTVTDPLLAGFTLVSATGTGWTCGPPTVTCTYNGPTVGASSSFQPITVVLTANTAGTFNNCTHIQYNGGTDSVPGNNDDCARVVVQKVAARQDVGINKTGGGNVSVGASVSFVLHPFNVGPGSAGSGDVTVTDTLPNGFSPITANGMGPGWNCTVAGQTITCNYNGISVGTNQSFPSIIVQTTAHTAGSFVNSTHIQYNGGTDTNLANNNSSASVVVQGGQAHDVKITKTTLPGTPHVGYPTAFSLNAINVGPGSVSSSPPNQVTITDTLPPGFVLITLGSGPDWNCTHVGNPVVITCTYIGTNVLLAGDFFPQIGITAKPTIAGPYTNSAHIQYNLGPDTNPADNTGSVSRVVVP
jgi:uncharacterized repeat protein (TIGR01451 family)